MFYLISNGNLPSRIYFNFSDAQESLASFIDVFDKEGTLVRSYKLVQYVGYTTDF